MTDPYTMVMESRVYGSGLDIGALAGKIVIAANGVPSQVRSIRDSVQGYINASESADLDQLLTDMGMLVASTPPPPPTGVWHNAAPTDQHYAQRRQRLDFPTGRRPHGSAGSVL